MVWNKKNQKKSPIQELSLDIEVLPKEARGYLSRILSFILNQVFYFLSKHPTQTLNPKPIHYAYLLLQKPQSQKHRS